jgi:hypothetical protein
MRVFSLDKRSLAVFRIGIAVCILFDLLWRAELIPLFYSDEGLVPRVALLSHWDLTWHPSLHLVSGLLLFQWFLFLCNAIAATSLLVGYRTRLATLVTWVLLISLQNRNPLVLTGADVLTRVLLFWALFLPIGARFSVDEALQARSQTKHETDPEENAEISVATIAFTLQVCLVYWCSGLLKHHPIWTEEGSAIYYTMHLQQFTTRLSPFLLEYPGLMKFLNFMTLGIERFGPFLLLVPFVKTYLRWAAILIFCGLHIGFHLFIQLGLFPTLCAVMWLAFLPSQLWDRKVSGLLVQKAALVFKQRRDVPLLGVLAFVIYWNLATLPQSKLDLRWVLWLGNLVRLDQNWGMFAPYPQKEDGWYVIPGKLTNGKEVDLFQQGKPVNWAKPTIEGDIFIDTYWRKYLNNMWFRDFSHFRLYWGRYLCRTWNENHKGEETLQTFDIFYMLEPTPPPGLPVPVAQKVSVWNHRCF